MPDHAKIAVKELRAAIHDVNESIIRLAHVLAHSSFVPELKIDSSALFLAKNTLEKIVLPYLVKSLDDATGPIGPQGEN